MIKWNNTKTYNRNALPMGNIEFGFGEIDFLGTVIVIIDEDSMKGIVVATLELWSNNGMDSETLFDNQTIYSFAIPELDGDLEEQSVNSAVRVTEGLIGQKIYQETLQFI